MVFHTQVFTSMIFFSSSKAVVSRLNLSEAAAHCFYLFETVEYNFGKLTCKTQLLLLKITFTESVVRHNTKIASE